MECEKNPFLQMSQDQIQKIEAVLSSEQARALLMETSKQNLFCDSKLDDVLSHEDGGGHLDLNKFPTSLDVTLEDSLQDLEHLVLGQHDNSELFSETTDELVNAPVEILSPEIRLFPSVDIIKLDHPYSQSYTSDQEEVGTEMVEEDEPIEEPFDSRDKSAEIEDRSSEYDDRSTELDQKSPPVRRSQRQIDKIEREKVEKIRAENAALNQREKEELEKNKEEESTDEQQDEECQSQAKPENVDHGMETLPSPTEPDTGTCKGEEFKHEEELPAKPLAESFEKDGKVETVSGADKKKSKSPSKSTKNNDTEVETSPKGKSKIKPSKDSSSSPEKATKSEIRKKVFKKEKPLEIFGPAEPELFSTPDKIVKQRSDSVSESNDKTPEKKPLEEIASPPECNISVGEEKSVEIKITETGKTGKPISVVEGVLINSMISDNRMKPVGISSQPQTSQKNREEPHNTRRRSIKLLDGFPEMPQNMEPVQKATEKLKASNQKKVTARNKSSRTMKADSSSDAKRDDADEDFVDDPNDSDWASDDDPEKLWCICRKPSSNRFMIQCDMCGEWFHGTCIGVTKQQGRQMEKDKKEWKCPPCMQSLKEEKHKMTKQESSRHVVKTERGNILHNCIICKTLAPKDSIYCTPNCIEKHAKQILYLINQKKSKKDVKEKTQKRIVVLDRRTGKLLTGPNAPTEENLITWLKDNPTFQALKPGPSSVKESKVSPAPVAEKKQKVPVKEQSSSQNDIELVRKNVIKTLTDILVSRCKSDSNLSVTPDQVKKIATDIEDELFKYFKDTGAKYKSKYRSLMFNVKDPRNQGLFRKIVKGKIPPDQLVRMSPEELASKELAKWRERENQHTLEMIKKEELEKQKAPATYVKKTHKGEIEIEDGSSIVIEKEEVAKVVKDSTTSETKEMFADTTVEHRAHLFDLNCKICTGRMPPPEDEDIAAKKAKISHTINIDKELPQSGSSENESAPPKKVLKSVKIVDKRHLKKKDEVSDSEQPTSTVCLGSPEQLQRHLKHGKSQSSVWKGFILMLDIAKFVTNAYKVSGPTNRLAVDIPDTVQVCGRIAPEEVWSYLSKIKQSGNKEIIIVRFQPTNEEEKTAYDDFYNYLNSRKRYGVVRNTSKMIKDFYIIPLPSRSPVPTVLMPFQGPGLDAVRVNLLLGVLVRHKGKSRSSGGLQAQTTRMKVEKTEVYERSYTPPLDSMPCQSTAIDSSNSPAYLPNAEKIVAKQSPKRSHPDDEPYEPSYTPPLEKFPKMDVDDDKPYDPEEVEDALPTIAKSTPPLILSGHSSSESSFMSSSGDLESQKKLLAELTRQVEVQKEQIELQKSMSSTQTNPNGDEKDHKTGSGLAVQDTFNLPHTLQNILDNIKKKTQDLKESGTVGVNVSAQELPAPKTTTLSAMSAKELLEKAQRELEALDSEPIPVPVVAKPAVSWHISTFIEPPPPGVEPDQMKNVGFSSQQPTAGNPSLGVYRQPAVRYHHYPNQVPQESYHNAPGHPSGYRHEAAGSWVVDRNIPANRESGSFTPGSWVVDRNIPDNRESGSFTPTWDQRDMQHDDDDRQNRSSSWQQRWKNY